MCCELEGYLLWAAVRQKQCHMKVSAFIYDAQEDVVGGRYVPDIDEVHLHNVTKLQANILRDTCRFWSTRSFHTQARFTCEAFNGVIDLLILDAVHRKHLLQLVGMRVA